MEKTYILASYQRDTLYAATLVRIKDYKGNPYDRDNVPFSVGSNQAIVDLDDATVEMVDMAMKEMEAT